jgi:hypothetical protein
MGVRETNWHGLRLANRRRRRVVGLATKRQLAGVQCGYIAGAEQLIDFRMDRNGAAVTSEATIAVAGAGRLFFFDRPFLVLLSKRGAKQPFFVMWVDNAELLQKR